MRTSTPRLIGKVGAALGVQAVPIGGVLGGWSPATGLVLYWIEAVIGVLLAWAMVMLYRRRISDPGQDAALGPPDSPAAQAARQARLTDLQGVHLRPREILGIQGGAYLIFGGFFTAILVFLSQEHDLALPSVAELRSGVLPLAGFALLGFLFDLRGLGRRPASFVAARVNAFDGRFGMMWTVCVFGPILMAASGRPGAIFVLFASLKTLYEVGIAIERVTGQRAVAE